MPNFDFEINPKDIQGSLNEFMRYIKWFTNNLDESNVKYLAWGDSIVDNLDPTHNIKMKFYIPDGIRLVQKFVLNFSLEKFRAYETRSAAGGAFDTAGGLDVPTSFGLWTLGTAPIISGAVQTSAGHTHDIKDHKHTIPYQLFQFPDHDHDLEFGIYEDATATNVKVYIDGTLRLDNGGTGYTTDQSNLDLTQWVKTAGWHTIELSSTTLGRINMAYFIQAYVGNNGI